MSDDKTDKDCTITLDDGTHYDLSPLSSAKADYEADTGNVTGTWKLNVCRAVIDELWNVEDAGEVGGFIRREDHGDFSIGAVSKQLSLSPTSNEPLLIYSGGSKCRGTEELASTVIRFVCSPEDFGAGTPRLVATIPAGDDACHFFFDWKTHVACPTNAKVEVHGAHVWAFIGLVVVAILTWFGGHTIYNRFVLGRRGMDQLPLPHISRPPGVRLPHPAGNEAPPRRGRWNVFKRRSERAGYNHIRADEPDEEDHLTNRFSLEDDDDHEDARVLGGEMEAWRRSGDEEEANPRPTFGGGSSSAPGVHQGLVRL